MIKKLVLATILLLTVAAPSFVAAQEKSETVSIVAVGDIMLGTIYPSRQYLPPNEDCSEELKPLTAVLSGGDVVFGNLEGVLTDKADGAKRCNDPSVLLRSITEEN